MNNAKEKAQEPVDKFYNCPKCGTILPEETTAGIENGIIVICCNKCFSLKVTNKLMKV